MASDSHRCGCLKGCKRSRSCQRKGHEKACLLYGCCYKRNDNQPALRSNNPPVDFHNKFNDDVHFGKFRLQHTQHSENNAIVSSIHRANSQRYTIHTIADRLVIDDSPAPLTLPHCAHTAIDTQSDDDDIPSYQNDLNILINSNC